MRLFIAIEIPEEIKDYLYKFLKIKKNSKSAPKIDIRIEPIKEPNLDAFLVAKNISDQLVKRLPHRRVLAQTVESGAGIIYPLSTFFQGLFLSIQNNTALSYFPLLSKCHTPIDPC